MKLKEIGRNFFGKTLSLADKFLGLVPEKFRKSFIFFLGGLVFIVICLTVMALAGSRTEKVPVLTKLPGIPADELFYPAEPDFLPPLLLEREPKYPWTIEDIEPYWKDPGPGNEDKWREEIIKTVDKLMEGVP